MKERKTFLYVKFMGNRGYQNVTVETYAQTKM